MPADPILALRKQALAAIRTRIARLAEQGEEGRLTQTELADQLGLSRPRLNLLMRGKAAEFSLEALLRIARSAGLGVKMSITRPYSGR